MPAVRTWQAPPSRRATPAWRRLPNSWDSVRRPRARKSPTEPAASVRELHDFQVPAFANTFTHFLCRGLLGLVVVFVLARGTGTPLRNTDFLELVEQCAVADVKRARCLFSVPIIGVQCI